MFRKPQLIAVGAVLLVVLVLLNLPEQPAARTRLAVSSLFLPLFGLVSTAQRVVSEVRRAVVPRTLLLREVSELRAENRTLHLQVAQLRAADAENQRLRRVVGWQQASPWKSKACRVIARDTADWWRTVRIELGSRDGARSGLPVVSGEGLLLGRLDTVGWAVSVVVLVGDPKCRVSVVVRESGETGVLTTPSAGVLEHRLVDLTHLPRNTALRPGQTVHTSGLGGYFPAGIPVGTVVDTRSVGFGLYSEARVRLFADSSRIEEVLVLLP
jgi:rod shape-determining protein MreC